MYLHIPGQCDPNSFVKCFGLLRHCAIVILAENVGLRLEFHQIAHWNATKLG